MRAENRWGKSFRRRSGGCWTTASVPNLIRISCTLLVIGVRSLWQARLGWTWWDSPKVHAFNIVALWVTDFLKRLWCRDEEADLDRYSGSFRNNYRYWWFWSLVCSCCRYILEVTPNASSSKSWTTPPLPCCLKGGGFIFTKISSRAEDRGLFL